MTKYNHIDIERKWQAVWEKKNTFCVEVDPEKPKYYVLDMFPYPSGAGLHVGHVVGYTATDVVARYKRMQGFYVLHPMGWDSFGLPAEQYAVRTGTHPKITTQTNIDTYRRQLKALGFSYDWNREVATSDPDYYKWTQWIFTKLYEKGLAFQAEATVNFCPFLGTVLANEEVDNGKSKEGGHPVIKKPFRQWMLKITEYAERLLQDLDTLDWPHSIKALQTNWIGKSEGALIYFPVEKSTEVLTIFTTAAHTIFGVSFLVLAPEHPLVDTLTTQEHKSLVAEYKLSTSQESEAERLDATRVKTGVFTGAYAVCPVTQKKIPIWIADYVLANYGTGAVQGVPAHDARDFEFAKKYDLPIISVIHPLDGEEISSSACYEGDGTLCNSEHAQLTLNTLSIAAAKQKVLAWLAETKQGEAKVQYKLRDWLFSRQRYWGEPIPVLHFDDGTTRCLDLDELPLMPPDVSDYKPSDDGQSPLAKISDWVHIVDTKTQREARRETNTMPNWAGSCWYYLRFLDPKNDTSAWDADKEKYWMPVDLYVGGVEHAVLHLLYARFWHKVLYDLGFVSTSEPFAALRNQGLVVATSYKTKNNVYVDPVDIVCKEGEYFQKETGEKLHTQIEKMSKSKLNGVSPDLVIEEFGADALRLYALFMGPLEKEKIWNISGVQGCRRFLNRAFDLVQSEKIQEEDTEEGLKLAYRLVAAAKVDFDALQFNTIIAKLMEFLNDFSALAVYPKRSLVYFVQVLSPLAPHIAEEMWHILQQPGHVVFTALPEVDTKYLEDDVVTYIIQVNGKLRARIELPRDQSEERIIQLAKQHHHVSKFLEGKTIIKSIFVPNKLLNVVVKEGSSE